jgi:1-acyl-sn-glycerol-3-phosphate acyltransferase
MIISNHVSWIDVLYLEAKLYPVSIVAKEEISNTLLVGLIARYLQCIFISRKDGQARKNVLEKI